MFFSSSVTEPLRVGIFLICSAVKICVPIDWLVGVERTKIVSSPLAEASPSCALLFFSASSAAGAPLFWPSFSCANADDDNKDNIIIKYMFLFIM
ncbi:hypothetical protein [Affinibrenneria salicis]|uniref:hypothetical protein n=1 Tax=Affinibrenneria salicis TaxID=2590031 RepID=UPI001CC39168